MECMIKFARKFSQTDNDSHRLNTANYATIKLKVISNKLDLFFFVS